MLRRHLLLFAPAIPRTAWDPAQFNPNWSDSYGSDIAARRHWPAKRWSIGLDPRTPRDWLQYSRRNLAYAYNGALRACQSLPEMLIYYKEMKLRGVKVDVDTMNVMLTRAARYEKIQVDDVFLLFDELTALGARPDIAAVETLHTVFDHSAAMPHEWREARRRQLVELYNHLAVEEIERLAPQRVDRLLSAQIKRYRDNLRPLRASLSPSVYRRYLHATHSAEILLEEVHNFLWELVENDHPAMDIPSLQMRVPFVASVMKRPPVDVDEKKIKFTDFEDSDVCSVFLAAAERAVDIDFHDNRPVSERRMFLSLLTMLSYSGVLYTADLMAHLMEMVKYSNSDSARDSDAQRLLRYAIRGSSAAQDEAYRVLWRKVELVADSRVVGRYISARDPWSPIRVCFDDRGLFKSYPMTVRASANNNNNKNNTSSSKEDENSNSSSMADQQQQQQDTTSRGMQDEEGEMSEGVRGTIEAGNEKTDSNSALVSQQHSSSSSGRSKEQCTVEALDMRWSDVRRLLERTGVLTTPPTERHPQQEKMEVFTGMAVYLRTIATGRRYGNEDNNNNSNNNGGGVRNENELMIGAGGGNNNSGSSSSSITGAAGSGERSLYADGYTLELWTRIFTLVQEIRQDMEKFIADNVEHQVEPEFECWESLLIILRCVLDFCVVRIQDRSNAGERGAAERLFQDAMTLRNELIEESRTRFNGRMRILWLQEA